MERAEDGRRDYPHFARIPSGSKGKPDWPDVKGGSSGRELHAPPPGGCPPRRRRASPALPLVFFQRGQMSLAPPFPPVLSFFCVAAASIPNGRGSPATARAATAPPLPPKLRNFNRIPFRSMAKVNFAPFYSRLHESLRIGSLGSHCDSTETLPLFSRKCSQFSNYYYHQDLH